MKNKTQVVIAPLYLKEFSCITTACSDSCCRGNWNVDIDEVTYKKYKRLKHPFNKFVEQYVVRNRSHSSPETFAKFQIPEGGCPLLNSRGLCQLHLTYGEEYLSNVCALYPRMTNSIDGILEKSATISCPEVARLVLRNPAGLDYEVSNEDSKVRNLIDLKVDTGEAIWQKKAGEYNLDIHTFTLQILKDRRYTLNDRMKLLGLFLESVDTASEKGTVDEIPSLIELFSSGKELGKQITSRQDLLMEVLLKFNWIQEFEAFQGLNEEQIEIAYLQSYNSYYLPFVEEFGYVIENYMVNYAFQTMFPLRENNTFFECYLRLLIPYLMIQSQLVSLAASFKGITVDSVVQYLIQFSKLVEHRKNYRDKLVADLPQITPIDSSNILSLII